MIRENQGIPIEGLLTLSKQPQLRMTWRDGLILVIGYIALDWASYLHPLHGFNITAWNPAPALALSYLLRHGRRALPPLALAILLADFLVRKVPANPMIAIALALALTGGYFCIGEMLRRHVGTTALFFDRRGLLTWTAVIGIGTLLNSLAFVGALWAFGLIPAQAFQESFVRYWVGDSVGILVTMPTIWMLLDPRGRRQLKDLLSSRDALIFLAATIATLVIAFGMGSALHFKYFYLLFLPVAWAATRHGLSGAVLCAVMIQIGIIVAVMALDVSALTVLDIQVLGGILVLFAFFIGTVVDEKQRLTEDLRQTLRLAAAGEMAGALAHELNQPLTALTAYGAACEDMLDQGLAGDKLRNAIRGMIAESYRAADVVRRLREFFKTGATQLEPLEVGEIVSGAVEAIGKSARALDIEIELRSSATQRVLGDRLQLEVVLRNLLSNAIEAMGEEPAGRKWIVVSAGAAASGQICIQVEDSGPGITPARAERLFEPFRSTKSQGMGLGLVISRAIVEAHGGELRVETGDHGIFKILLPTSEQIDG